MNNEKGNNEISAELKAAYINAAIDRAKRAEPLRRLRMRLMYAEYKVRQGWSTNTLDEVSKKYSKLCSENKKKRPEIYDMNKHFFTDLIRESGDSTLNSLIGPDTRRSNSPYGRKVKKPVRKSDDKQNASHVVTRRQSANQSSHQVLHTADSKSNLSPKVSSSPETPSPGAARIDFSNPSPEVIAAELILSFRRGSSASRSTNSSVDNDPPSTVVDNIDGREPHSASPASESSEDPVKTEPEPQTQLIPVMQTQAPQYIYGNQFHHPVHQSQHSQYGYIAGHPSAIPRGLNLIAGAAGIV